MKKKLNLQAYSNDNRNTVIEAVKNAILISGGGIINFNMFSDLALSLNVEIEENKVQGLYESLSKVLMVSEFEPKEINPYSDKEMYVFLNISFGSGKGDLKQELPEVPG